MYMPGKFAVRALVPPVQYVNQRQGCLGVDATGNLKTQGLAMISDSVRTVWRVCSGAHPLTGAAVRDPYILAPAVPTTEPVIPDWPHALMLGTLQAVAAAAADPGCLQGWGLAGCLLGPYLLHPADLSRLQPVCTATTGQCT